MKQVLFKSRSAVNCNVITEGHVTQLLLLPPSLGFTVACWVASSAYCKFSHLLIPEFRESVHNDTKDDVEANGGHNDEKGYIIEETSSCIIRILYTNILMVLTQCCCHTSPLYNTTRNATAIGWGIARCKVASKAIIRI